MDSELKKCDGWLYDPPEGWRYGFPKIYHHVDGQSLEQTLLKDGYPQSMIDEGMANYTRFIPK